MLMTNGHLLLGRAAALRRLEDITDSEEEVWAKNCVSLQIHYRLCVAKVGSC